MRITNGSVATALKSIGAQLVITSVLGALATAFGAGAANAAHGAVPPAPAHRNAPAAGSAHWSRVGPWRGDEFLPYIVAPTPTDSIVEQPASSDDATWPPTGPSWPPGGGGGGFRGSGTPIVMPHASAQQNR